MPTKHIDDTTWRKVEVETVRAVVTSKSSLKDTEILRLLIEKGIEAIEEEDYVIYAAKKKK